MSTRGIYKASNIQDKEKRSLYNKHNSGKQRSGGGFCRSCRFRLPKLSELNPVRLLKHLGNKVACLMPMRRRKPSTKVSSSGISKPSPDPHTCEAMKDCIDFINSSTTLQRSNSVPANPC